MGSDNLLMINAHVAHDCTIGDRCILANNATLAGHVSLDDYVIIGGMTAVHADGVNRVPSRLISLGLLAGVSPQALAMLAAGAFDAVVHLERVNGQRRITQIGELRVAHGELAGTPLAVWNGCHPPRYAAEWGHFIERWGIVPGPSGGG